MEKSVTRFCSLSSRRVDGYTVRQLKVDPSFSEFYASHNWYAYEEAFCGITCSMSFCSSTDFVDSLVEELVSVCLTEELTKPGTLRIPPSLCSNFE